MWNNNINKNINVAAYRCDQTSTRMCANFIASASKKKKSLNFFIAIFFEMTKVLGVREIVPSGHLSFMERR